MITSTDALAQAVTSAQLAGAVGIDTEFVWERSYYPSLGLVQIGYPDGECALIDAPEIEDWSPFAELMADPATTKILHDAQQDLTILHRACGAVPKNVFDTQRSCGFINLPATISLSDALKKLLKVRLAKTETRSNWLLRPLSTSQLEYAADDVRHSVRLMEAIRDRADALQRGTWIEQECRIYEHAHLYCERDPDLEMPRVKGSGALTHSQRAILRSLGSWRELKARKRNLPRSFILSDEALVHLTKKTPKTIDALQPIKGLSERTLERNREAIWQAIERGQRGDLPPIHQKNQHQVCDEGYEARVDLALAFVKGLCLASQLDPALIGNRAEITALVVAATSEPDFSDSPLLAGWRADFCGQDLMAVLSGKGSIGVNPETRFPEYRIASAEAD